MKVTLTRQAEGHPTQRAINLPTVVENMKTEIKSKPVSAMRENLQYPTLIDPSVYIDKLPRIHFGVELQREEESQVMKTYNGLVLLSIGELVGKREAGTLRDKVAQLPQTMIAFVGSSGKTLKIIVPFCRPDGTLPQSTEEALLFHAHAYRWAVNFYQGQLQQEKRSITLRRPLPDESCRFSYDPGIYFAPNTYPIHIDQPTEMPTETTYREAVQAETDPLQRMLPGYERSEIISTLFEASLHEARGKVPDYHQGEEMKPLLIEVARNCFRSGIPEEEVVSWIRMHFGGHAPEALVRLTVHNVYDTEKHFGERPCITRNMTTAIRTDEFMARRYEFRYNTLTASVEYRERKTYCFDFQPMTERVLNTIAVNAISEGLDLWDRDVKRWVNSARVPLFSPIDDVLFHLPRWDGRERIRVLAGYVPCNNVHWPEFFHRWFLAMVSHWQGGNKKYANSVSPLLVGSQGCGKSTFCRNLLPPEFRMYFTDSIDFSRKRDAELYLNRFLLINIDEFDQVSTNHQGFLKHILQKPVVNTRKPHQTAVQELRRYASFIATSNHSDLLSDPSGSRRFICIKVTGEVRNDVVINYQQLYAQALHEIREGERCYFSPEEEALIMEGNQEFELKNPVEQLFQRYYRGAEENEVGEWLLAVEILERIQKKSGIKLSATKIVHFGRILSKLSIPTKKMKNGNHYHVAEL